MKNLFKLVTILISTLWLSTSSAGEWDFTGFVGVEAQVFWQGSQFPAQQGGMNGSLLLQPELYWRSDSGRQRFSAVGFARGDAEDSERSHADLREFYWGIEGDEWDLNIGLNKVFWGVAESRHLVDVINQTDQVEDVDQEDKLGQPMLNVNLQRDFGQFGVYIMPWFRERTFGGEEGRFRPGLTVDMDNPIYESSDEDSHLDYALRYSHYIGDVDVGAHYFDGTSREPRFAVNSDGTELRPIYDQMTQFGIDVQYTRDAWLWKLEAISRDTRTDSFVATVGGVEYTFYGVRESAADIGIIVEYLYDGRNTFSAPTSSDDDVFVGARLALNDANDTSLLAGVIMDVDSQEVFLSVEAERRFGDNLSAELRLRAISNSDISGDLTAFANDDYIQLRLSWYY